jgi:hypothetical protein
MIARRATPKPDAVPHEPPPTAEIEAAIAAVEADDDACGLSLEAWAEWVRGLLPGYRHGYGVSKLPLVPTTAQPGTAEKVRVMTARARRGEALFHPQDAKLIRVVEERGPEEMAPEEKAEDETGEVSHA